jgi:hypothetical protein
MLTAAEIARGSQGAIKFLLRDATAPLHFANTIEACLRSFQVMILVAPFYAAYIGLHYLGLSVTADTTEIVLAEALRYVVNWLLFPVIFYEIARWRGWLERYPRYIGACNWAALPSMVALLLIELVSAIVPSTLLGLLQLALEVYWFLMITQLGLGVSWPIAVSLCVVNLVPSHLLSVVVDDFLGISYPG